jgi:two-component system response regulator NreC
MIRVLLAEDHETVREGLRLLLDAQSDMMVVGEVGDGRAAVDAVAVLTPDVVVLDLSMPTMGGLAAARSLRGSSAAPAVVALTRHDDDAFVQQMIEVGVAGYVLKQSASAELLQAIRVAAAGGSYIDTALSSREAAAERPRAAAPRASDREVQVLRLIAIGHSNKEIAAALNISVKTVEVHKANAMRKLGLRGRTDVVRYAVINGWLDQS